MLMLKFGLLCLVNGYCIIGNLALRIFGGNSESRQGHGFTISYEERMMKKVRRALGSRCSMLRVYTIVLPTKAPKSLMAAKSFVKPVQDAKQMQNWIGIMSAELHNRIMTNLEDFSLWPKTLTVSTNQAVPCVIITLTFIRYTSEPRMTQSTEPSPYPCIHEPISAIQVRIPNHPYHDKIG